MPPLTVDQTLQLALQLQQAGYPAQAEQIYRHILAAQPSHPDALHLLGVILGQRGQFTDAVDLIRRAIAVLPNSASFHSNLGAFLHYQGQLSESINAHQRAIALKPDSPKALGNLGNVLRDAGYISESLAAYRRALAIQPDYVQAADNLLYSQLYDPAADAQAIVQQARQWNAALAVPLEKFIQPHTNAPATDRRLRIGYVSPDFREHPAGRLIRSLLSAHDHQQFEIFCYSNSRVADSLTAQLQGFTHAWRNIADQTDEQTSQIIRADQIDILVDLSVHMAHNRLLVFARKPAPVQITYMGYPGTTGMRAMDYRLTDPYLDPPGSELPYVEKSLRLPDTFWCESALEAQPAVSDPPSIANGFVTFGSLNNPWKMNATVIALWSQVLRQVRDSRLLMLCPHEQYRARLRQMFADQDLDPQRIDFVGHQPRQAYLQTYHRIDIGLDTVPYNGHATSLDSLWMGVPVVTLVGQTVVGRAGLSLASNLDLKELVAHTCAQFVQLAVGLANDRDRIKALRGTLRERMRNSPLTDAPAFARGMEAAYRTAWRNWCDSAKGHSHLAINSAV